MSYTCSSCEGKNEISWQYLYLKIISKKSFSASHPATFFFKFQATIHVDFYDSNKN
jgi:hypothetical protein